MRFMLYTNISNMLHLNCESNVILCLTKNRRKLVCIIFGALFLALLVFVGQLAVYILSEFVLRTHRGDQSADCIGKRQSNAAIPQHIHQIFFYITDKELPKVYQENQNSWRVQNPGYSYTLWNATMIEELIRSKYPEIEKLYHSYEHWVRRADVARYLILHQFGGFYVDIDLKCIKPLSHLIDKAKNKGIISLLAMILISLEVNRSIHSLHL